MPHAAAFTVHRAPLSFALWRWLIVPLLSLGFFGQAAAGYANAVPAAGWGSRIGSSLGFDRAAANAGNWVNGRTLSSAVVNVGGRAITMPVGVKLAANAASYAATAARATPAGLATGVIAAWLLTYGIEYFQGQWTKNESDNLYCRNAAPTDCGTVAQIIDGRMQVACVGWQTCGNPHAIVLTPTTGNTVNISWTFDVGQTTPTPYTGTRTGTVDVTPNGGTQTRRPAVEDDWAAPAADPLPDDVANAWPGPLPVDLPALNPNPEGVPQPVTIPLGQPVPVPGTSPQEYEQPVADVVPLPTPAEPWRIDLTPRDNIGTDPNGVPEPDLAPTPAPTPVPVELEPWCGISGKPDCTVKVNETGTPEAPVFDVPAKVEEIVGAEKIIAQDPTNNLPLFPELNWSFSMPTACGPIALPAFSEFMEPIDLCVHQETFHSLMSVVWVMGGLFGAINMFMRNALATT